MNYSRIYKNLVFVFLLAGLLSCSPQEPSKEMIYVGTYSGKGSEGLYVFEFDRKEKQLTEIQTVNDRENPNFQTIYPNGQYLYSVSSESFHDDTGHGTVVAYSIDQ